jgi:membrane-bound ClpP family serine protease
MEMLFWGTLGVLGLGVVAEFVCGMIMGFESYKTSALAATLTVIAAAVLLSIRMGRVSWFTLAALALFPIVWIVCQILGMGLSKIIFRR